MKKVLSEVCNNRDDTYLLYDDILYNNDYNYRQPITMHGDRPYFYIIIYYYYCLYIL